VIAIYADSSNPFGAAMRNESPFVVAAMTFLTFSSVILLVIFWPIFPDDLQSYVCDSSDCTLQVWLPVIFTAVGTVAAVGGAFLVIRQLEEQRIQTAFMIGDGKPSIESVRPGGPISSGRFMIINWNRRTLVIAKAWLTAEKTVPVLKGVRFIAGADESNKENFYDVPLDGGRIVLSPNIPGWINRNSPPHVLEFELLIESDTHDLVMASEGVRVAVNLCVRFPGTPGEIKLDITPTFAETFSSDVQSVLRLRHFMKTP
jgi:hypothetical protein